LKFLLNKNVPPPKQKDIIISQSNFRRKEKKIVLEGRPGFCGAAGERFLGPLK
jgi:hypothetical protein